MCMVAMLQVQVHSIWQVQTDPWACSLANTAQNAAESDWKNAQLHKYTQVAQWVHSHSQCIAIAQLFESKVGKLQCVAQWNLWAHSLAQQPLIRRHPLHHLYDTRSPKVFSHLAAQSVVYGNKFILSSWCLWKSINGATPFFDIIKQRDHKYATHSLGKQFYVLAPLNSSEKQIYGKGVAHFLFKNEGVAPMRELL